MEYNYLYIMNYALCEIYEINLAEDYPDGVEHLDIESILDDYGLNIDECAYMYAVDELIIKPFKKD